MMMNLMNPPLKFVAIALNDYGGICFEFYSLSSAVLEGLREKEEEAGGSGWGPRTQAEVGVPAESQHHDSQEFTTPESCPRLYAPRLAIFHRTRLGH